LNPERTSKNVAGDFYTTGYWVEDGECGYCLDCALPEGSAPDLLADIESEDFDYTHFIRQPVTEEEIEQACDACEVCCVNALRYGGKDINIISRLYNTPDYNDYVITESGKLKYVLDEKGEFLPFSLEYKEKADKALKNKYGKKSLLRHITAWFKS
jgi:hypothetical protein